MARRIRHADLSMPYLLSLKSVDMENIMFLTSESEISPNDKRFFQEYFLLYPSDTDFPNVTEFPNLRKQLRLIEEAEEACLEEPAHLDEQHKPKLYIQDTYKEFHDLFISLLDAFNKCLAYLVLPSDKKPSTPTPGDIPPPNFQNCLTFLGTMGSFLQLLTKGTVLVMHLRTIESSLEEHRRDKSIPNSELVEDLMEEERDEDLMEEGQDEDLQAIQASLKSYGSTQQIPLHMSYKEWLKLMIVNFDAIDVLRQYVGGLQFPFKTIDIKILVSPQSSTVLLPWRELFDIPEIFATDTSQSDYDLRKYLEEGAKLNINDTVSTLKKIKQSLLHLSKEVKDGEVGGRKRGVKYYKQEISKYLNKLIENSDVFGWKELVQDLLKDDETSGGFLNFDKIDDAVTLMLSSNQIKFFKLLHDTDENSEGLKFIGTIHCEVSLASLLDHYPASTTDDTCKDIRAQLKVCYTVSNLCMSLILYFFLLYF